MSKGIRENQATNLVQVSPIGFVHLCDCRVMFSSHGESTLKKINRVQLVC